METHTKHNAQCSGVAVRTANHCLGSTWGNRVRGVDMERSDELSELVSIGMNLVLVVVGLRIDYFSCFPVFYVAYRCAVHIIVPKTGFYHFYIYNSRSGVLTR